MASLPMTDGRRIRLLFFAEAVTLAHVARPLALAVRLDPARYEIAIACDPRYARFVEAGAQRYLPLASIPSADFVRSLAAGKPVYDEATLEGYVAADRVLLDAVRPDIVVGDFRISLAVSARLAGCPYITITNGYWSPAYPGTFPLPVLPMTRWLPIPVAAALFRLASPVAMALHCRPMNAIRQRHGLVPLGARLRRVYTDADHLLCADAYPLIPADRLPADHSHLGPLLWAPPVAEPDWWRELPRDTPLVYVTLGSSGPPELLGRVLDALAGADVICVASTAGAVPPTRLPRNARAAPYLDGSAAAARARLVVCNGGSPTTQQALAAGVPVLGLASNMDQMLNMQSLEARGAGVLLRADRASTPAIAESTARLLRSEAHRAGARAVAETMRRGPDAATVFDDVVRRLLATSRGRTG